MTKKKLDEKKISFFIDQGNQYYLQKNYSQAILFYKKVLTINPRQLVALNNLATVYEALGEIKKAETFLKKAVCLRPDFIDSLRNLGFLYFKTHRFRQALFYFNQALKNNPEDVNANYGKILTLKEMGLVGQSMRKVLLRLKKIGNLEGDFLVNLGNLALRGEWPELAEFFYQEALKKKKNKVEILGNLVVVYILLLKKDKERETLKKIIALTKGKPALKHWLVFAYNRLALSYTQGHQYKKAEYYLKKCLAVDPTFYNTYSNLYLIYRQLVLWEKAEEIAKTEAFQQVEDPLINISRFDDPKINLQAAQQAIARLTKDLTRTYFTYNPIKKKIRLGYLSSDFRHHPIGHLIASLFQYHNRDLFMVYAYSAGVNDKTYWRKKVEKGVDVFTDIALLKPDEAARLINNDQIDILIDLTGFTLGTKLDVCFFKPAPIQVEFLGYPGTSGADFMDYLLVDKIVVPQAQAPYFSEKLVYLPGCYQINDGEKKISTTKYTRQDWGLPPTPAVVFCSFNQNFKIEPVMFSVWMEILKKVPDSVLWLISQGREAEKNLIKEAEKRGVVGKRLVFSPMIDNDKHLKRLSLADIALDTRLYNGHTTTSDALYAGVPVVTLLGKHFPSRVAGSILTTYGVPELITQSLKEYQELVIDLATNRKKLIEIRKKIRQLRPNNPLFDTKRFVRKLEKAYFFMWRLYLSGQPPKSFVVDEE